MTTRTGEYSVVWGILKPGHKEVYECASRPQTHQLPRCWEFTSHREIGSVVRPLWWTFRWRSEDQGLPWWLRGKETSCQCRRYGFDPWVRKIPWSRKQQLTSVFLPGKSTDRETWWATVHEVAKSGTWLNPHERARIVILKNGISVGWHFTFVDLHSLYRMYWNIQIYVATISWPLCLQILDSFKSPYW